MARSRERKREWELAFRATGARMVGIRISAAAANRLAELRELYDASDRDVIEGLLLGNVNTALLGLADQLGVSVAEARLWAAEHGVQSTDASQTIEDLAHHLRQRAAGRGSRTDWGCLLGTPVDRSGEDASTTRHRRYLRDRSRANGDST